MPPTPGQHGARKVPGHLPGGVGEGGVDSRRERTRSVSGGVLYSLPGFHSEVRYGAGGLGMGGWAGGGAGARRL